MPKHNFKETTAVNNNVFFQGEAEVSEADAKALRELQKNENETDEKTGKKETGDPKNK